MPFRIGIFVKLGKNSKKPERLEKWLPERYTNFDAVDTAVNKKNRDLKADLSNLTPGQKFAMFDDC